MSYAQIALIALFIASLCLNLVLLNRKPASDVRDQASRYPLLSKRIFAENQNDILINFTPLRNAMHEYVAQQPELIGAYFEYLPSGTSIGINDQMEVKLASLIKVPVVMASFRQIEKGALSLDQIFTLTQADLDSRFGSLWERGVGTQITVEAAIIYTLVESDNTAANVLLRAAGGDALAEVFDALDLPKHKEGQFVVLSPKNYSSILRSLYLSSYLERGHSNDVLDLLTGTKFNDKLPAGVPDTIPVAHKIGVFKSDQGEDIFNDCGIVYLPDRPYTLCMMVLSDEETTRRHMQHLSKMVYGYVAKASN